MKINKYEHQVLTRTWDGPPGASYNAVYEFCYEDGLIDQYGIVTPKGHKAIEDFENIVRYIKRLDKN